MIVRRTNRKNANNGKYISGEKIISKLLHKKPNVCRDLSNNKKELLDKWVGNPDGISGKRLTSELKKEIF